MSQMQRSGKHVLVQKLDLTSAMRSQSYGERYTDRESSQCSSFDDLSPRAASPRPDSFRNASRDSIVLFDSLDDEIHRVDSRDSGLDLENSPFSSPRSPRSPRSFTPVVMTRNSTHTVRRFPGSKTFTSPRVIVMPTQSVRPNDPETPPPTNYVASSPEEENSYTTTGSKESSFRDVDDDLGDFYPTHENSFYGTPKRPSNHSVSSHSLSTNSSGGSQYRMAASTELNAESPVDETPSSKRLSFNLFRVLSAPWMSTDEESTKSRVREPSMDAYASASSKSEHASHRALSSSFSRSTSDRAIAVQVSRDEHTVARREQLPPVLDAFVTNASVSKKWENVTPEVEDVHDGICITLVLPFVSKLRVKSSRGGTTVTIEAERVVNPRDRTVTDENSQYCGDFKIKGKNVRITDANISYDYCAEVGLLQVFVDRVRLASNAADSVKLGNRPFFSSGSGRPPSSPRHNSISSPGGSSDSAMSEFEMQASQSRTHRLLTIISRSASQDYYS